jgi:CDP-diglyceride synthetase
MAETIVSTLIVLFIFIIIPVFLEFMYSILSRNNKIKEIGKNTLYIITLLVYTVIVISNKTKELITLSK